MNDRKGSSLLKSATLYTAANLFNAITPFLLLKVLTNNLSQEGYGLTAMFTLLISFFNPLIGLSTAGAITKQFFQLDQEKFKQYVLNCLLLFFCSIFFFAFLVLLINPIVFKMTDLSLKWLFYAIFISSVQYLMTIVLTIFQVNEKPLRFGVFQVGYTLINITLSIILVAVFDIGWLGRIYAWTTTSVLACLFCIFFFYQQKFLKFKIDREFIKHALRFSLPLIPHAVGGLIIGLSDRVIIKNLLGIGSTGIYTVAFQLASIITVIMTAFNNAYVPWLFKRLKKEDIQIKRKIVGLTYIVFISILAVVLVGTIFSNLLLDFVVGGKFIIAKIYIPYLLLGFGFNGMYLMVTNYLFYAEKTVFLARNTLLIGLLNLPICYFLTQYYGLMGASIAIIISYFLLFVTTWVVSFKAYPMPWFKPAFSIFNETN